MTIRKSTNASPSEPRGFALIEVLVAVGLLGIVSAGVASLMGLMVVTQSSQKYGNNLLYQTEQIRSTLSSPAACTRSFLNTYMPSAANGAIVSAGKRQIFDSVGQAPKYTLGTQDLDKTVQITNLQFSGYKPVGNAGFGEVQLIISYAPLHQVQAASRAASVALQTQVDNANNLISCVSLAGLSNDIWQIVPKSQFDIFFNAPTNGNVGIGTATPSYRLDVEANSDSVMRIYGRNSSAGGSAMTALTLGNDSNPLAGGVFVNSSSNASYGGPNSFNMVNTLPAPLAFGTSNIVNMVMDKKGNVGIGNTTPVTNLHITSKNTPDLPGFSGLVLQSSAKISNGVAFFNSAGQQTGAVGSAAVNGAFANGTTPGDAILSSFTGNVTLSNAFNGSNTVPRLTITPNGYVGIGTTKPLTPFHVTSGAASPVAYVDTQGSSAMSLKLEHRGSNLIVRPTIGGGNVTVVENTGGGGLALNPQGGNVGIGTTSPQATFHILAPSEGNIKMGQGWDMAYDGGNDAWFSFQNISGQISGRTTFSGMGKVLMDIENNGNVGIGTMSPAGNLTVSGNKQDTKVGIENTNGGATWSLISSGNGSANPVGTFAIANGSGTPGLVIAPNGYVGFGGATNPWAPIEIDATRGRNGGAGMVYIHDARVRTGFNIAGTANGGGSGQIGTISGHNFDLYTGNNTWVTLIHSSHTLSVEGDFWARGTVTATTVTQSSDIRLKKDVATLDDSLNKILQLRGVTYHWKDPKKPDLQLGLIAQEVQKVYPEVVVKSPVTGFYAVNYQALVAPVIEAIKSLAAKLATVWDRTEQLASELSSSKDRISHLEQENAELKARLDRIEKTLARPAQNN